MIQILDKKFDLYLTGSEILTQVQRIAAEISLDLSHERPVMVCILKGALFFFADLLEQFDFPYDLTFYRVSSYDGTTSTQKVVESRPFPKKVEGRTVVIVEDVVETGGTIQFLREKLFSLGAKEVLITTLFFKPHLFQKDFPISYYGFSISDEFIVGYGMDYREEGRTLPDLYQVVE